MTRPEAFTDATEELELDQVTSFLVASEGETVALSCNVSPMVSSFDVGLTDTDSTRTSSSFGVHEKRKGREGKDEEKEYDQSFHVAVVRIVIQIYVVRIRNPIEDHAISCETARK